MIRYDIFICYTVRVYLCGKQTGQRSSGTARLMNVVTSSTMPASASD